MLRELLIKDFKLLREVSIQFSPQLTALTGETGAGKTQCLEALIATLGTRCGEDAISKDSEKTILTAVFDLSDRPDIRTKLIEEGWLDEGEMEVVLERTIERSGPSRGRLNGRRVPLNALQAVGERLVDTLGQNARADILTRPALEILDALGDSRHQELVAKVRGLYVAWQKAREAFDNEKAAIERARERQALAEFQYTELNKAELSLGQEAELTKEFDLLCSTRERIESALIASEFLSTENEGVQSAREILQSALDAMENLSSVDPSLEADTIRLREMVFAADELASTLRRYSENIVDDPSRTTQIENRIRIIHELKRKYRLDEAGLVALRDSLMKELEQVAGADDRLKELASAQESAMAEYVESAGVLSKARQTLGKKISKEVKTHLADLDLPKAEFEVAFTPVGKADSDPDKDQSKAYRPDGIDRAEFMIATNQAQTPGPLKKVASGGELSRLLIALKTVLADRDRVPVLVFDEAEAGIGGETAFKVGEKLKALSKSHQLILVSHLPQIASQADMQWVVMKSSRKNDTQAEAREVQGESRVEEISRMLGARGDKKALEKLARSFLAGT